MLIIRCSRSPTPIQYGYQLNDHIYSYVLGIKEEDQYLGIILHKSLSWSSHISKTPTKASQILKLLRRNLNKCSPPIKALAYTSITSHGIHSNSQGAMPAKQHPGPWKFQHRAAHLVMDDHNRYCSVSDMLHNLNLQPLQLLHRISRLQILST